MCYFFQAEDGIRDIGVTGVQTCALPIFGAVAGAVSARRVRMTAMPQMVALFNGVGGGAAALVSLAEFHELAPLPGDLGKIGRASGRGRVEISAVAASLKKNHGALRLRSI